MRPGGGGEEEGGEEGVGGGGATLTHPYEASGASWALLPIGHRVGFSAEFLSVI